MNNWKEEFKKEFYDKFDDRFSLIAEQADKGDDAYGKGLARLQIDIEDYIQTNFIPKEEEVGNPCNCICHKKGYVNDCHYLFDNKCESCGKKEDKRCNSKHCSPPRESKGTCGTFGKYPSQPPQETIDEIGIEKQCRGTHKTDAEIVEKINQLIQAHNNRT